MEHEIYMRRCLELAAGGEGHVSPNPMVGCVIVHDGKIIGEGWHRRCGEAHAEVNAIGSVKEPELLRDSTLYVSLEPCCHWGKTPPCADLILQSGIPRVVVGMADPFPKVAGGGIRRLRDAGVDVTVGVLERECRELNRKFVIYHTKKRPYILLKWAQTVDGYLDNNRPASVPPAWMTGPVSRVLVHRMRAASDAILTGTNTVERDDPSLTVRDVPGKNPLRIVLDRALRLSPDRKVFDGTAPTLIYTLPENVEKARTLHPGCEAEALDFGPGMEERLLDSLYRRQVQSLMVEGGAALLESLLRKGLWDEANVFVSPLRVADLPGGTTMRPLGIRAPEVPGRPVRTLEIDGVRYLQTRAFR